jgi:hypothetical protein
MCRVCKQLRFTPARYTLYAAARYTLHATAITPYTRQPFYQRMCDAWVLTNASTTTVMGALSGSQRKFSEV